MAEDEQNMYMDARTPHTHDARRTVASHHQLHIRASNNAAATRRGHVCAPRTCRPPAALVEFEFWSESRRLGCGSLSRGFGVEV